MGKSDNFEVNEVHNKIASIAVIDLETCNLPQYNCNKTNITELSIYGFAASELTSCKPTSPKGKEDGTYAIPSTPRVMHKLSMLFNPRMTVELGAEEVTGLNNYNLEYENEFDDNAAKTIIGFVQHLQQPVCLVAHNGWNFDFPIVKKSLDKVKSSLPAGTLCVDSLRAFMAVDEVFKQDEDSIFVPNVVSTEVLLETDCNTKSDTNNSCLPELKDAVCKKESEEVTDRRTLNETTPRRPTIPREEALRKRRQLIDGEETPTDNNGQEKPDVKRLCTLKSRRALFTGHSTRKYPPKGVYKLGNMYQRIFSRPPTNAHQAEADVCMLTKIIQHYGIDFLAFAESQAIPFEEVLPLGTKR